MNTPEGYYWVVWNEGDKPDIGRCVASVYLTDRFEWWALGNEDTLDPPFRIISKLEVPA